MSTTQISAHRQARKGRKPSFGIYLALAPWVLFALIAHHGTLDAAAVAALAGSLAIALPSLLAARPKLLEIGAILSFAAITVVAFTADPAAGQWLARYARALAAALLALIAFSSLLVVPFTEQYARELVSRPLWSTPRFKRINQQLTIMWALVFTALVPSHLIAGVIDTPQANLIFNWALPVALIVWAAKRTSALGAPNHQTP